MLSEAGLGYILIPEVKSALAVPVTVAQEAVKLSVAHKVKFVPEAAAVGKNLMAIIDPLANPREESG